MEGLERSEHAHGQWGWEARAPGDEKGGNQGVFRSLADEMGGRGEEVRMTAGCGLGRLEGWWGDTEMGKSEGETDLAATRRQEVHCRHRASGLLGEHPRGESRGAAPSAELRGEVFAVPQR